jgi:hypothetical protein
MDPGPRSRYACLGTALLMVVVGACTSSQAGQVNASPPRSNPDFCRRLRRHSSHRCRASGLGTSWLESCQGNTLAGAVGLRDARQHGGLSFLDGAGGGERPPCGRLLQQGWVGRSGLPNREGGHGIEARPLETSEPLLTNAAGASVVDLPKPGCWTFRLSWIAHGQHHVSTINLEVLPAGTMP